MGVAVDRFADFSPASRKKGSELEQGKIITNRIMWSHFHVCKVFYAGKRLQA